MSTCDERPRIQLDTFRTPYNISQQEVTSEMSSGLAFRNKCLIANRHLSMPLNCPTAILDMLLCPRPVREKLDHLDLDFADPRDRAAR